MAPEDFLEQRVEVHGEGSALANKPPGHVLMVHMLNNSPMLQMILYVIDEATRLLDRYASFPGKKPLERAALLCIKLVETTLEKQEGFLNALRASGTATMVSQMDKLLLAINPRSNKPSHLVNITKYIMYNDWLPEHSLVAVRILHAVCRSTLVQPKIVSILTDNE
ncbi:hypothetical protein LSAT2_009902, partial [Lamellibrachia satsuma]